MATDIFADKSFDSPPLSSDTDAAPQAGSSAAASRPPTPPPAVNVEPDTCRICRGDGTPQEPLFYPCKCSGSIKYVHQDCLMEWLSHSQKKHCELCKTSFRFTKLYSPNMPKKLPFFVFVRHLTKYFLRNVVVWLRIMLVATVWLGLLPALTRWEWSFFFWVSEEGLVYPQLQQQLAAAADGTEGNGTSVASLAAAAVTTAANAANRLLNGTAEAAASAAEQAQADPYGLLESSRNTPFTILSIIFNVLLETIGKPSLWWIFAKGEEVENAVFSGPPTLLSDVSFLHKFCRFPVINKLVIFVIEGQFITLLVVVCFILIILVRDYVLQQQPEINLRAAFNAGEEDDLDNGGGAAIAADEPENDFQNRGAHNQHHHHHHDHDHDHDHGHHNRDQQHRDEFLHMNYNRADWEEDSDWETDSHSDVDDAQYRMRALAQGPERNGLEFRPIFDNQEHGPPVPDSDGEDEASAWRREGASGSSRGRANLNQPNINRDEVGESSSANASSGASFRDPMWTSPTGPGATVHEYMSIYRRANGDHERILEIAREEGREEHLQYWLRVMQSVADRQAASKRAERDSTASTVSTATADVPEDQNNSTLMSRSSSKGKRRADLPEDEGSGSGSSRLEPRVSEFTYGLRPRANTDGPTGVGRINPLANNNWSFGPAPAAQTAAPLDPLFGDVTSRLDSLPATGQSSSIQGPADPFSSELRRRPVPTDSTREPPVAMLRRGSSNGMANIDEEADDTATPLDSAEASSSTDASAALRTPSSSGSNSVQQRPAEEGEWDDVSDDDDDNTEAEPATNNESPRENAPAPTAAAAPPPPPAAATPPANDADTEEEGFLGDLANFMFRDLDDIDPADLPPIVADEEEEDHVAIFNEEEDGPENMDEQDRQAFEQAAAAAAAANLEAEAIEDAEDLEGVMELLGMRGPLIGLFQNVVFCGFLVTISLLIGIFMPYNFGRLSVWLVANPMRPVMLLFTLSRILQDMAASVLGGAAYLTLYVVRNATTMTELLFGYVLPYTEYLAGSLSTTWDLCTTSAARVVDNFNIGPPFLSTGEIRNFSAVSHEALIMLKAHAATVVTSIGRALAMILTGEFIFRIGEALDLVKAGAAIAWDLLRTLPEVLVHPGSWVITLDSMDPITINPEYAFWDGIDRSLAIISGYASMCLVAGLYLHNRGAAFANGAAGPEWEAPLIEGLQQASGVLKVILIIGIEMLVFPLYCGLLLDIALLPLFENTTLMSRLYFSVHYPMTSIFVHWFVGTGYMFHFALFVSMCRKIMRKGVLYFIRDPDDPEFHPVRDVLERSVTTQLRKILFSAFVYGALVIICLGGVVWGLAYAGPSILPIHYSSNEPVLEFPIDLLFYNFLMPLAIRFFKPSDGLHSMYTWWFRKSARGLRITWFLFGDRRVDEEGILALAPTSPHQQAPWIARQLLMYDEATEKVVPVTLLDPREVRELRQPDDKTANANNNDNAHADRGRRRRRRRAQAEPDMEFLSKKKYQLVVSGQLLPDGRFVRAPASDQVKIPKGKTVFLDVTDAATLMKELQDTPLSMLHGTNGAPPPAFSPPAEDPLDIYHGKQYQLVYIPPHFRMRVFMFIASIWLFAAVTGVSFTIIPLLFGRRLFRMLLPADVRTNDIYAFSIGIYVLGSASYFVFHARSILIQLAAAAQRRVSTATARNVFMSTARVIQRTVQLTYAYFFILIVFPLIATALVELYALIPLHTYMYPPGFTADGMPESSRHTIRIIQSWTLGLLYLKVAARTITTWYPEARLASAIRAVLRRGNLDPDVRLLTRAFIVPGLVIAAAAIGVPLLLARGWVTLSASSFFPFGPDTVFPWLLRFALPKTTPPPTVADLRLVYRLSFPFVALVGLLAWSLWGMVGVYESWKLRIRDEAYLIGERLHNFGGTPAPSTAVRRAFRSPGGRV
ncbi:hypothetical protein SEUCBS139899_002297 [Sporothrix eucalyptigena]